MKNATEKKVFAIGEKEEWDVNNCAAISVSNLCQLPVTCRYCFHRMSTRKSPPGGGGGGWVVRRQGGVGGGEGGWGGSGRLWLGQSGWAQGEYGWELLKIVAGKSFVHSMLPSLRTDYVKWFRKYTLMPGVSHAFHHIQNSNRISKCTSENVHTFCVVPWKLALFFNRLCVWILRFCQCR